MLTRFRRERRKVRRKGVDLPVQFRIYLPSSPDSASPWLPGQLLNFSNRGIALLTNAIHHGRFHIFHYMPTTSEQCLLEVRLDHRGEEVALHGRVVWYDRNGEENPFLFRVGIELLDGAREFLKRIEDSLQEPVVQADSLM